MKHEGYTPGPWRVEGQRIEYGPYVAGDGWCVAKILRDPVEHEANARLIADAPRLAEENERLRASGSLLLRTVWDALRRTVSPDGQREALEEAANEFKAALARVEGRG